MEAVNDRRVCLLTGAGGTLGAAFCARYRRAYRIAAICGRRVPSGVPTQHRRLLDPLRPQAALPENDDGIFVIAADLADRGAADYAVDLALQRFGRIDVVVNAAADMRCGSLLDDPRLLDGASEQLCLNVLAPARVAVAVGRAFWRQRYRENISHRRNVINMSSTSAAAVFSGRGQSIYGASKAALNALTLHMAEELRPIGIRVNALAPTSFPKLVATEAVADAVAFLDKGEMTGQSLVLDPQQQRRAG